MGTVSAGHYARKQIMGANWLIAWSHRARFTIARQLVRPFAGASLLDYGCGDGTFLAAVMDLFPNSVGADPDASQIEDCRQRFAPAPGVSFVPISDLRGGATFDRRFQVVTCMEVLEHCTDSARAEALSHLAALAAPGGVIIVSVPIEIGPTLVGKQFGRALAGRSHRDYVERERYTPRELLTMVFAGRRTSIQRPVYHDPSRANSWHGHKGFNWRQFRDELRQRFDIERTQFSPLSALQGWLSSQVWFVCRPR